MGDFEQGMDPCRVKQDAMTVWAWIAIGVGSFLALSVLVGLAVAAVLGEIARRVSELHESEGWASAPPKRALAEAESQAGEANAEKDQVVRLR
jgi:hypothetical protein